MGTIASQITSLTIVYSTIYSGADQRKHQSSASLAFVWGIHRGPVQFSAQMASNAEMFPFDDVIMWCWSRNIPGYLGQYHGCMAVDAQDVLVVSDMVQCGAVITRSTFFKILMMDTP